MARTANSKPKCALSALQLEKLTEPHELSSKPFYPRYDKRIAALGRRSHNYSSRPPLVYAGKYQSKNQRMVLLPYGEVLKRQRAAFHQMLQPRVVGAYEEMQHTESIRLLADLATVPADWSQHCGRFAASLVFTLSYGQRRRDDGKDLAAVQFILDNFVRDTYPGAHLVDTFPILDRLPDFLCAWRAEARRKHDREVELYTRLSAEVKERMARDLGMECFSARLWDQQEKMNLTPEELSYNLPRPSNDPHLIIYPFSSLLPQEAEFCTICTILLDALRDVKSNNAPEAPEVTWLSYHIEFDVWGQISPSKAQQELDSVCTSDTMPGFAQMKDLPYCFALVKEVFRWSPAAPGGFPHYTDADDEYLGYAIRKGTMVIPCIWNMHHNEAEFPNSYTFDPERFLSSKPSGDSLNEGHYGFGFGRRKCPGQYLAAKTIWIAIVRVLWGFNIEIRQDAGGNAMNVDPDNCTSGMTS
ncbi:cytochrome P450 [Mycena leptocephala]|nr:cytochrome P450 [Mycena leptocephala]